MNQSQDVIDARPETIGSLLTFSSTPNTILVPIYQRFYQWDNAKVTDLLHLTDPDSQDFGFLGTMVFVKDNGGMLEVVDGQQRILSLILILCALRDYIKDDLLKNDRYKDEHASMEELARDIQSENLLVSKSYSQYEDTPRIVFKRTTYEIFKQRYLKGYLDFTPEEIIRSSEPNTFDKNYHEALTYLSKRYENQKGQLVPLLYKRLERLRSLVVNAIYISDGNYAGEVFESINGTGVTLKLSELVKNYLYRSIAGDNAHLRWEQIEQNANGKMTLVERVIKYDWQNRVSISDDFEIFRSIRTSVKRPEADTYLTRLVRVSKIFLFYLHPNEQNFDNLKVKDYQNDKGKIIRLANSLRTINVLQFLRVIIALDGFRDFILIKDYIRLLTLIQNFQVRAKITGVATNDIDRVYSKIGKKLEGLRVSLDGKRIVEKELRTDINKILFEELVEEMRKISTDFAFQAAFRTYSRTKTSGKDFFKYLLSAIESYMQRKELVIDGKDNQMTLEEIYPQDPSEGWKSTDLTENDIYLLANATILIGKDNGAGSNKIIDYKKPIYAASNLKLNQQIVGIIESNQGLWDKRSIENRAETLSKDIIEIWHL